MIADKMKALVKNSSVLRVCGGVGEYALGRCPDSFLHHAVGNSFSHVALPTVPSAARPWRV